MPSQLTAPLSLPLQRAFHQPAYMMALAILLVAMVFALALEARNVASAADEDCTPDHDCAALLQGP
ncbi:MAG: hypothetical protein KGI67_13545 [Pseudomonadota bacterium]|nr:hypothetical protein [Pseudomonadota bacterium]